MSVLHERHHYGAGVFSCRRTEKTRRLNARLNARLKAIAASPPRGLFSIGNEIRALSRLAGSFPGIYLAGFLIASPVFVFLSLFPRGRSKPGSAALIAVLTTAGIWLVFSWLMNYKLFRGAFFEELY